MNWDRTTDFMGEGRASTLNAMVSATNQNGVIAGLAPSMNVNGNDVNYTVGEWKANGAFQSKSAGTVTLSARDATYSRYSLIVGTSSGTIIEVAGTASTTPNPPALSSSYTLIAGVKVPATGGGNITVEDARVFVGPTSNTNLLNNPDFGSWSNGVASAPNGWTLNSGTVARDATNKQRGSYGAALTAAAGVDASLQQLTQDIAYYAGKTMTCSAWIKSSIIAGAKARLYIVDSVGSSYVEHNGNGAWQNLSISRTVSAGATYVGAYLFVTGTSGPNTAYFDAVILVEGNTAPAFSPAPVPLEGQSSVIASPSRAKDMVYQNLSARPLYVSAQMHFVSSVGGVGNAALCRFKSDASNPPTTLVTDWVGIGAAVATDNLYFHISTIVAAGHYYILDVATGLGAGNTGTLTGWQEFYI